MTHEAATIASPCILVCSIEAMTGHCFGCGRTGDEIGQWLKYGERERAAIMEELPARLAKLERPKRRQTKRARLRATNNFS